MRLFTAKTSSDSFPPQTQAGRVNVKVNSVTDHNTNITVLIGRAELTVSRLFSKISRASSLLHSSSMHSRSRFPFLLSSNRVLARLCRCRNWEAWFCERTGRRAHENIDCLVNHHGFEWPMVMQVRVHNIYSKMLQTEHDSFTNRLSNTSYSFCRTNMCSTISQYFWLIRLAYIHQSFTTLECHVNTMVHYYCNHGLCRCTREFKH